MDLDDPKASFDCHLIEHVAGLYVPPQDFVETDHRPIINGCDVVPPDWHLQRGRTLLMIRYQAG